MIHTLLALWYPPRPGDVFIAGHPAEEAELARALGPRVSVFQVVNPMEIPEDEVNGSKAAALRASWGFPDGATVLLYGHRIYRNKGLDLLIEAMALLPRSVHLVVIGAIGDTRFSDECSNLVARLGLHERVRFLGPVGRDDIVTKTCQSVELLRDAVAVAEASPTGLTERIQPLLDPTERAVLGRKGRELIRDEFGPSAVAQKLEQIYRTAL
jgi:glycosyltransferase involved in cell wall biosynthesis